MVYKDDSNISALQFNRENEPFLATVCAPLFTNFNLTHFGYIKLLSSNQMLRVTTSQPWAEKYFECQFYNDGNIYKVGDIPVNQKRSYICSDIPGHHHPNNDHQQLLRHYNMWNHLFIFERFENHCDMWTFGTTPENLRVVDLYLNESQLLYRFIAYLKYKAPHLFGTIDKSRLINLNFSPMDKNNTDEPNRELFLKDVNISKFYFPFKGTTIYFSQREADCLYYLIRGKSMKEIARLLHISPRTVETHIEKLKAKLHCHSKMALIQMSEKANPFWLEYKLQ